MIQDLEPRSGSRYNSVQYCGLLSLSVFTREQREPCWYMMRDDLKKLEASDSSGDNAVVADVDGGTGNSKENIKVLVRIRPLLAHETGQVAIVSESGNVVRVNGPTPNRQLQCCYDAVLGPEVSQDGTFSHVRECISAVLAGENSTVFAYGQTGSGKTYTMFGPQGMTTGSGGHSGHGKGVIPLAVADLFLGLVSYHEDDVNAAV